MKNTIHGLASAAALAPAFILALALAFVSCGGGKSGGDPEATGIAVLPVVLTFGVGDEPRTLTATVQPPNAAGRDNLVWQVEPPEGIVEVVPAGSTATVTPVGIGEATVTVRTTNGKSAECAVTVTESGVAVDRLLLPKTIAVKSAGGLARLAADIWPYNAANRNITWTSDAPSVAAVSGSGPVATITGGDVGTARITATSQGNASVMAQCTVTVAQSLWRDVYLTGGFGVLKNGHAQAVYEMAHVNSIFVDSDGVEHAAGSHFLDWGSAGKAAYFRNGEAQYLPCSPSVIESIATAMHVASDGSVFIAGSETLDDGADMHPVHAKLWKKSAEGFVDVQLGGVADAVATEAMSVCASGGNVYVAGVQSLDGYSINAAVLWVNQAKTAFTALKSYAYSVAAFGGDVYMAGPFGLMRVNPDSPSLYQLVSGYASDGLWGSSVNSVRMFGGDVFAAGWVEDDPVLWKNHSGAALPWHSESDYYEYSVAVDVFATQSGAIYAIGNEMNFWGSTEPLLWMDGEMQAPPNVWPDPVYIFVNETAGVQVADVVLEPATLEIPIGYTRELVASIVPESANNRELTWDSDNHDVAIAVPTTAEGTGTVIVRGLSAGSAIITARSQDGPSAACLVKVYTVQVEEVSLPSSFSVGIGRTGLLAATITPPDATNQNATWQSSNSDVATVAGTGLVGAVRGVELGTATVTITTDDGGKTDSCVVTVSQPTDPAIYIATKFGLYVDGLLDATIGTQELAAVHVDDLGSVHAAGQYYNPGAGEAKAPAYYLNGSPNVLPATFGGAEPDAGCHDMAIADDGRLYIVGYESDMASYQGVARLWVDQVQIPLGDIDETGYDWSHARAVCVRNGITYVAGGTDALDWSQHPVIWKDGAKHEPILPPDTYMSYFIGMGFDSGGTLYALGSNNQLFTVEAEHLSAATRVEIEEHGDWWITLKRMFIDGTDVYVVGYHGNTAAYWKNGSAVGLESPEGAYFTEADAAYVYEGRLYVAGFSSHADGYHIQLWIDGQLVQDERAIRDVFEGWVEPTPAAVFVKM